ncbi:hypothetical protein BKA69DRAFT_1103591 [Paraphysoderma sedebokerense]|nr:hypothetical protein BKA69DRAFT_1103591 [Paraphysoderma sedebokerense]
MSRIYFQNPILACRSLFKHNRRYIQFSSSHENASQNQYALHQQFYQNRVLDPYVNKEPKRVTLRQLVTFGRNMNEDKLLRSANHIRHELPVRLAHRIRSFQHLPFILITNPHISQIYNLYLSAFQTLSSYPPIETLEQNYDFCETLRGLLKSHLVVIPKLALGMWECQESGLLGKIEVDRFITDMLKSRISRRVLAQQHLSLSETFWEHAEKLRSGLDGYEDIPINSTFAPNQIPYDRPFSSSSSLDDPETHSSFATYSTPQNLTKSSITINTSYPYSSSSDPKDLDELLAEPQNHIGLVCTNLLAYSSVVRASEIASSLIRSTYDTEPPKVVIGGHVGARFTYIPDHIEYVLLEVLKNGMKAVIESTRDEVNRQTEFSKYPEIEVTICEGPQDIIFRISDQGGGIPEELLEDIYSFASRARFLSSSQNQANSDLDSNKTNETKDSFENLRKIEYMAATVHEQIESLPHSLNPGETDANSFETDGSHDATIDKAKPEPLKQFYGPLSGSKTDSSVAAGSKNEATKERSNQISKKLVHLGFGFPMSKVYLEYWYVFVLFASETVIFPCQTRL